MDAMGTHTLHHLLFALDPHCHSHFLNSPHFYFPKIPSLKLRRQDHKAKAEEDDNSSRILTPNSSLQLISLHINTLYTTHSLPTLRLFRHHQKDRALYGFSLIQVEG
jgi:hypothetical protein